MDCDNSVCSIANQNTPPTHKPSGLGKFFKRIRTRSKSPATKQHSLELVNGDDCTDRSNGHLVGGHIVTKRSASTDKVVDKTSLPPKSPSQHRGFKGWLKNSVSAHSREELDDGCSTSPRSSGPFGSFVARLSGRKHKTPLVPVQHSILRDQDKRATLSEEDLVSKSLASELASSFSTSGPSTNKGQDMTASTAITTPMITSYHSQESVFDTPRRQPSYLRVSCALSGYRNYRPKPSSGAYPMLAYRSPPDYSTPLAQSIVERRLEKFEKTESNADPTHSSPLINLVQSEEGNTPTPVKDLIKNFDKLKLNDTPTMPNVEITDTTTTTSNSSAVATISCISGGPLTNSTDEQASNSLLDEVLKASEQIWQQSEQNICNGDGIDGHWFEQTVKDANDKLELLCVKGENDLETEIPEAAADTVRLAVGKARLLMRKKLKTFVQLIQKNLNPIPDDPCPAMLTDLEGYWAVVNIELEDVQSCFDQVEKLRMNDWQNVVTEIDSSTSDSMVPKTSSASSKQLKPPKCASGDKKGRDKERREKLRKAKIAARQRMKAENGDAIKENDQVQIFMPE